MSAVNDRFGAGTKISGYIQIGSSSSRTKGWVGEDGTLEVESGDRLLAENSLTAASSNGSEWQAVNGTTIE